MGNGVTNWKYDGSPAYVHMAYYHGLIDDKLHNAISKCDLAYVDLDDGASLKDPCDKLFK